jgi:hypothetical protein
MGQFSVDEVKQRCNVVHGVKTPQDDKSAEHCALNEGGGGKSFIHSFIQSFIIHSFTHSLTHSL